MNNKEKPSLKEWTEAEKAGLAMVEAEIALEEARIRLKKARLAEALEATKRGKTSLVNPFENKNIGKPMGQPFNPMN